MSKNTHTPGQACYAWITPEEVVRHALAAYYANCRECDTFQAEPADGLDLLTRHGRSDFATSVGEVFGMRLMQAGHSAGLPGFSSSAGQWLQKRFVPAAVDRNPEPDVLPCPASVPYAVPDLRPHQDIHRTQLKHCSAWGSAAPAGAAFISSGLFATRNQPP